jgi:hypothetical protein
MTIMFPRSASFFTLEAAVYGARSWSDSEAAAYVVVDVSEDLADPASGPWGVLPLADWVGAGRRWRARVVCRNGALQCVPA